MCADASSLQRPFFIFDNCAVCSRKATKHKKINYGLQFLTDSSFFVG